MAPEYPSAYLGVPRRTGGGSDADRRGGRGGGRAGAAGGGDRKAAGGERAAARPEQQAVQHAGHQEVTRPRPPTPLPPVSPSRPLAMHPALLGCCDLPGILVSVALGGEEVPRCEMHWSPGSADLFVYLLSYLWVPVSVGNRLCSEISTRVLAA